MQLVQETSFGSSPVGGSCFVLDGPSNNNAEIRGLSFKGGSEPNGGGLVVSNCSPKFENLIIEKIIRECRVESGLKISNKNNTVEIQKPNNYIMDQLIEYDLYML